MDKIKLGIGVPLIQNTVPVEFFESFVSMRKPNNHVFFRSGGYQGLDVIRNNLVDAARKYGCTHLLFLDIDHRHNPDTITKLLSHNLPIVSGLSFMRVEPYSVCAFNGMINNYKSIENIPENELIEVDSVGSACLLVNMEVFDKIKKPYFSFMKNPDPNIQFDIGEDVYFCNLVKQAGYKIFIDTSCTNKHLGTVEVDKEFSAIWNRGEK